MRLESRRDIKFGALPVDFGALGQDPPLRPRTRLGLPAKKKSERIKHAKLVGQRQRTNTEGTCHQPFGSTAGLVDGEDLSLIILAHHGRGAAAVQIERVVST